MLDLQIVIQLCPFLHRQWRRFLTFKKIPYALSRSLGRCELEDLARAELSDELNDFLVRFHESGLALASTAGKLRGGSAHSVLSIVLGR
jgi:hypothetical protein